MLAVVTFYVSAKNIRSQLIYQILAVLLECLLIRAVHYTSFSLDGLKLMSCSDDTTVHCWDLATTTSVVTMRGHADYVRTGGISQSDSSLWFTGSYDHLVKLWDIRTGQCVQSLCHGAPLECILVHPTGGICFSAGTSIHMLVCKLKVLSQVVML